MTGEGEYGLVMPFIVCASVGGPYEDQAFVAGYQLGIIDNALSGRIHITWQGNVRTDCVPQADLIAMRHHYAMTTEDIGDGWTSVEFRRAP